MFKGNEGNVDSIINYWRWCRGVKNEQGSRMLLKGKWHGLQMCIDDDCVFLVFSILFSHLSLFFLLSSSCNRSSGRLLHIWLWKYGNVRETSFSRGSVALATDKLHVVYIYFIIRIAWRIRKGEKIIINNSTQRSNEK